MPKVIPAATVSTLTHALMDSACFARVERGEVRHELGEVEFSVSLSPGLSQPFVEGVRDLAAARRTRPADNELAAVLEALLVARLGVDEFEVELEEDVDPDEPVLPEAVTLVVRIVTKKKRKKKSKRVTTKKKTERVKKTKKTRPDISKMPEAERRDALRRDQERLRSKRRRDDKRPPGTRLGRPSYTEKAWDFSHEWMIWRPTKKGAKLMREMDRVWEKTIFDRAALVEHLRRKRRKTLSGRPITRNMLTDLLRHLDRLRLGSK